MIAEADAQKAVDKLDNNLINAINSRDATKIALFIATIIKAIAQTAVDNAITEGERVRPLVNAAIRKDNAARAARDAPETRLQEAQAALKRAQGGGGDGGVPV